jgi:hypothetical protein
VPNFLDGYKSQILGNTPSTKKPGTSPGGNFLDTYRQSLFDEPDVQLEAKPEEDTSSPWDEAGTFARQGLEGIGDVAHKVMFPWRSALAAVNVGVEEVTNQGRRVKPTGETFLGHPQYDAPNFWNRSKEAIQYGMGEKPIGTLEDEKLQAQREAEFAKTNPKLGIAESVGNVAGGLVADPLNVVMAGGALPKAASRFFALQMAAGGAPETYDASKSIWERGLDSENAGQLAGGLTSLGFSYLGAKHGREIEVPLKKPSVQAAVENAKATEGITPPPRDQWRYGASGRASQGYDPATLNRPPVVQDHPAINEALAAMKARGQAPPVEPALQNLAPEGGFQVEEPLGVQPPPDPAQQFAENTRQTFTAVLSILNDHLAEAGKDPHTIQEVIVAPERSGLGITPDGTRLIIGGDRMHLLFQGEDALDIVHNIARVVSHEVLHPGQEALRNAQGFDPTTGKPTGQPLANKSGHSSDPNYHDGTVDLGMMFEEHKLLEGLKNDSRIGELAGKLQRERTFSGAELPPRPEGVDLGAGTQSLANLQLARELGEYTGDVPVAAQGDLLKNAANFEPAQRLESAERTVPDSFEEAAARGAAEQAQLEADATQPSPEAMTPPPTAPAGEPLRQIGEMAKKFEDVQKPESMMDKLKKLLGHAPKAKNLGGRPRGKVPVPAAFQEAIDAVAAKRAAEAIKPPPGPATSALLNREGPAFPKLTEPTSALGKMLARSRAPRDQRAQFERVPFEDVLKELETRAKTPRLGLTKDIKFGELWQVHNTLDKFIRNKMGGFQPVLDSSGNPVLDPRLGKPKMEPVQPEAKKLWARLKSVEAGYPRAFRQSPRALLVGEGTATPRQKSAVIAAEERTTREVTPEKSEQAYIKKPPTPNQTAFAQRSVLGKIRELRAAMRRETSLKGWLEAKDRILKTLDDLKMGEFLSPEDRLQIRQQLQNLDADAFKRFGEKEAGEGAEPIREIGATPKPRELADRDVTKWRQNITYREQALKAKEAKNLKPSKIHVPGGTPEQKAKAQEKLGVLREKEEERLKKLPPRQVTKGKPKPPSTTEKLPAEYPQVIDTSTKPLDMEGLPITKTPKRSYAPTEPELKALAKTISQENPLHARAASVQADRGALAKLLASAKQNVTIDKNFIEKLGLSKITKSRVRVLFSKAAAQGGSYEARRNRFIQSLADVWEETLQKPLGKGEKITPVMQDGRMVSGQERVLEEVAKRSQAPLEKDFMKALPSTRKMSPLADRQGPWTARKSTMEAFREHETPTGEIIDDPISTLSKVAKSLSEELGSKVSPEFLKQFNLATDLGAGKGSKMFSRLEALKGFVSKVAPLLEKKIESLQAAGKTKAASNLQAKFDKLLNSETLKKFEDTTLRTEKVKGQTIAPIRRKVKLLDKFEKLPRSMQPSVMEAGPTGKRPGIERVEDEAIATIARSRKQARAELKEDKEGPSAYSIKTSKVGLSDKFAQGEKPVAGSIYSAKLEAPRVASTSKLPPLSPKDVVAKNKFIKEQFELGKAEMDARILALQEEGHLRTPEENLKATAKGRPEYPELHEELSLGMEFDPAQEYWVNPKAQKKFETKLQAKLAGEWEQQRFDDYQGRLKARQEARAGTVKEKVVLSPEVKDFLQKAGKNQSTMSAPAWVEAHVVSGDIPAEMQGDATYQLKRNIQAAQTKAGRRVKSLKLSKEEAAERFAIQHAEEMTPPPKASEKDPWEIRQIGATPQPGSTAPTAPPKTAREKLALKAGSIRESAPESAIAQGAKFVATNPYINLPRSIKTAFDLSNPLNQTFQLTTDQLWQDLTRALRFPNRPATDTSLAKNLKNMVVEGFGKDANYKAHKAAQEADPWFKEAKDAKVNFMESPEDADALYGADKFQELMGKLRDKNIPVISQGAAGLKHLHRGSTRAFQLYQNKAMRDAYKGAVEFLGESTTPEELAAVVNHINNAASRPTSKLTVKTTGSYIASSIIFSPQMLEARAKMLTSALAGGFKNYGSPKATSYARNQALRSVGGAIALAAAVKAAGILTRQPVDFDKDIFSPLFGKVKVGKEYFEASGGWGVITRTLAQVVAGKKKDLQTSKYRKIKWSDPLVSFFENKMAPLAGTAKDFFLKGKTRSGEEFSPAAMGKNPGLTAARLTRDLLIPISLEDFHRIATEDPRAAMMIPLMLLGANMSPDEPLGIDWAKTSTTKAQERSNREELKMRRLPTPKLSNSVTLPGRNNLGERNSYTLNKEEATKLEEEYMPQIAEMLSAFINSKAYRDLPEEKKAKQLHRHVLALQRRFSANKKMRGEVIKKFKAKELKPTNVVEE